MSQPNPTPLHIIILGAGITGLSTALAITKYFPPSQPPVITVLEIRPVPSTIGGAVNLTPNALRYLNHVSALPIIEAHDHGVEIDQIDLFEIYNGSSIGAIDFRGPSGHGFGSPAFKARRIMRGELLQALLEAASNHPNIEVKYGKKTSVIEETDSSVTLRLDDDEQYSADLLIGCDGIHSAVRNKFIEPARKPIYSGVAVAMSSSSTEVNPKLPFKDSAVYSSRRGSLMLSYFEPTRTRMYIGAVMQTPEVESRDGWRAKGKAQDAIKQDVIDRFDSAATPAVKSLIEGVNEWFLYPVYKLPPKGKWATERMILLGDAAHAMPPQGESTGIALEDAITFSRTLALSCASSSTPPTFRSIFNTYESSRRARIDKAYDEAVFRWETTKDSGWLVHKMKTWMTPWFIWWTEKSRAKGFQEDLGEVEIEAAEGSL